MAFTVIMPLLTAALASTFLVYIGIYQRSRADSACRKVVYATQTKLAPLLQRLLDLNPKAEALRRLRQIAETNLQAAKVSLDPIVVAAAEAHLNAVILQQTAFSQIQKELLLEAQFTRLSHRTFPPSPGVSLVHVSSANQSLAVHATPENSLTPNYEPDVAFESRQEHRLEYKQKLFTDAPVPVARYLGNFQSSKTYGCSATLKEEEWNPILRAVNL